MNGKNLLVVFVDRTWKGMDTTLVRHVEKNGFRTKIVKRQEPCVGVLRDLMPLVTCFAYDHPDSNGLADLRETKAALPSIPLLLITHDHSESLAVWAFRTRVWDYFVHPLDIDRFLCVIRALRDLRRGPDKKTLAEVMDRLVEPLPLEARVPGLHSADKKLTAAMVYVERKLHTKILQRDLAAMCGLTTFQFSRLFKRVYGKTFQDQLIKMRIAKATKLLNHPLMSVTDVCFAVGFSDASYFARAFKQARGMTPSDYRALQRHESEVPVEGGTQLAEA